MVKDSKENQVIPVEDVVRKDLVEYQALSSNGSLLCNASAHDGSLDNGAFLFLKIFPLYWKFFIILLGNYFISFELNLS